ncbi:Tat pathway signal sequence domain protein [Streptomyces sp. NPDC088812]|uniref:Tat pathway signal sequence domain protein n=1 Tax=Streptomyces sp. NPDC088812 TaxID=3365905 RepID=UPI0037F2462B
MRTTVRRHLGKVVAGAGLALTATAAMIAITLPGPAGADGTAGSTGQAAGQAAAEQETGQGAGQGTGQGAGQQGGSAAVEPGVVEAAPAEGTRGEGRDPLTDDESARAERIALNRQFLEAGEDVDGDRGPQRLGVDLAEPAAAEADDPDAPRRAEVTFYDYKDDTLVTRTVNLDTGTVESTGTQQGVQPPLNAAEEAEAVRLLLADPLGAGLKADYKDATGRELASPDQLVPFGMVYHASPGAQPAAFDSCGVHRCVRLLPKVRNGPWIDARSLLIDLSDRKVGRLTG